jgi:hypothetical protein
LLGVMHPAVGAKAERPVDGVPQRAAVASDLGFRPLLAVTADRMTWKNQPSSGSGLPDTSRKCHLIPYFRDRYGLAGFLSLLVMLISSSWWALPSQRYQGQFAVPGVGVTKVGAGRGTRRPSVPDWRPC